MLSLVPGPQHAHFVEEIGKGMIGMQSRWRNSHATLSNHHIFCHFWISRFAFLDIQVQPNSFAQISIGVSSQELRLFAQISTSSQELKLFAWISVGMSSQDACCAA